ncbi:MAG: four helix bundle protein [Crocinitomicaceae bacterium]
MLDFTDLEVWKEARVFRNQMRVLIARFPADEKFRLKDQLLRSSRSITNNISEGHGRFHFQENIQFCRTARGSLTESKDHLIVALDSEFISQSEFDEYMIQYEKCIKMLNGYINFLRTEKRKEINKKQRK